ncbi:MAG: hypothetical protein LJE84_06355 [Gammaproteobacteria bacterium]|nr:hypothetical protein [Gammaproteobacteria bacterium]
MPHTGFALLASFLVMVLLPTAPYPDSPAFLQDNLIPKLELADRCDDVGPGPLAAMPPLARTTVPLARTADLLPAASPVFPAGLPDTRAPPSTTA